MSNTLIITPQWIITLNTNHEVLEKHSLVICDDKIAAILPCDEANTKFPNAKQLQLPGQVIMPGLINMHTHIGMNIYRGIADDLPLMTWLQDYIWPAEQATMDADAVTLGSKLAIAEMIRAGITCFNDHYFFPQHTAQVVAETGIRASLGCIVMDIENIWAKGATEMLQRSIEAMQQSPDSELIRWCLAPHSPYMLNDQQLIATKQASDKYNLPVHIHLHETETEIAHSLQHYKKRPIARLKDLGLLNEKLIAVHMVHLQDNEITEIAESSAHVVHCPESNLKLASGNMPYQKLYNAGVNISLGTDGAVSNNDLDLLAEARTASLIHKGISQDPTTLPVQQALQMLTNNAAKALNWQQQIGSLEVGKQADMISIDLNTLTSQPVYNPMSQIIYACQSQQVQNVWVAGKQLLQNGEHTTINVAEILQQAEILRQKISPIISTDN
jgi:5-methylthioadenosine/S-adenosylhomocysteine deaminase